jgi:hypothetical protein
MSLYRYIVNKNAYKKLNNNIFGGDYKDYDIDNFYIIHRTYAGEDQLLRILKDGYLRPGKDVEHPYIMSELDLEYVYTLINFDDINNVLSIGGCRLFFHPKLLYDFGGIFNTRWYMIPDRFSIYVDKKATQLTKFEQIQKIKQCLIDPPHDMIEIFRKTIGSMHELLFDKAIPLSEYLIGVECEGCNENTLKRINKLLEEKYPNATLINDKYSRVPPKLKDIIR